MEIGSDVFAQEVEPTGLLSMEMMLARCAGSLVKRQITSVCFTDIVMLRYMEKVSLRRRRSHVLAVAVPTHSLALN